MMGHAGSQALRATEGAVEIHRRLAAANPAAFEPDLAMALNNLSFYLASLGRREQALVATEEAVEIYRRLAAANPAAFEPNLATALNNLGMGLANLGRREQALAATEEAVEIYRHLAAANSAAFEPDLARALWGFAWVRAAAQTELRQAVVLYSRQAEHLPGAFTDHLRGALGTMADVLDGLDHHEEADELRPGLDDTADDAS